MGDQAFDCLFYHFKLTGKVANVGSIICLLFFDLRLMLCLLLLQTLPNWITLTGFAVLIGIINEFIEFLIKSEQTEIRDLR